MLYSANWLQEYSSTKLPNPEKLADLVSLHAFEVEEVKKHKKDTVLAIDVLPNRAHDCLNHVGMAREIAAIHGKSIKPPKTKKVAVQKGSLKLIKAQIQSATLVPRYAAFVIEGVRVGKSPKKVQEYLESVGVNSINNIVDLTNFVMLEMGQPLHAFDYDQIQGQLMRVRPAKSGEKLETLDEATLQLPQGALIIEDANRLIDLAGIKGGRVSGISSDTKNIVLQAANFHPTTIYKTKKILKYTTQAADIYSHGIDPNLGMQALERANQLLQEWGIGGKVIQVIDEYPKKAQPKQISLKMERVESLLGFTIARSKAKKILQDLGCTVTEKGNILQVQVPTGRIDLTIPEDLVEEIGRIYGYENIETVFPAASLIPPKKNYNLYWREIVKNTMEQLGFVESYNYSFVGQRDLQQFSYTEKEKGNLIELENPISEDFTYLRNSLLENLIKNIESNQKKFDTIRIFELGKVFSQKHKKFAETNMLGAVLLEENFYAAKGVVDFLFQGLGVSGVWYDTYKASPEKSREALWHQGKSAEIKVGNTELGFVGEISSKVTANLKIKKSVAAIHINMEKLIQLASEEKEYVPVSKFPAVTRDIAVLVPTETKVVDVMNIMNTVGKKLIQDVDLFDMYEGSNLPEGKKNLAFRIIYQAGNRTLKATEVDKINNAIIEAIEKNPAWQVRK